MPIAYDHFPPEVIEKLGNYVYRLIDPRNGETFYVGRGVGNRVFAHVRVERNLIPDEDEISLKIQTIRAIKTAGLEVIHIIHKYGMDEKTAEAVEAALINAYPGLTNIVLGAGSNDFGPANAKEIIINYSAKEAVLDEACLLININQSISELDLYMATRYAWRLNPKKTERAKYVLAVSQGIIREVFIAEKWLEANEVNFPGYTAAPGRYGFDGYAAPESIQQGFRNHRIPEKCRSRSSNPIRYTYD